MQLLLLGKWRRDINLGQFPSTFKKVTEENKLAVGSQLRPIRGQWDRDVPRMCHTCSGKSVDVGHSVNHSRTAADPMCHVY